MEPLISICCVTYNHERFITDAIEGFLKQKTSFPFEILIHDDASTDGTPEIIRQYAEKYPALIFPIFQSENKHSQGILISMTYVWPRARGKYIALCEGDDYWHHPEKLHMQVSYLEQHPECGLVHSDYCILFHRTGQWQFNAGKDLLLSGLDGNKEELFYRIINDRYRIRTATVVFRKELVGQIPPNDRTFKMGDTPLWLDLSQLSGFHYFDKELVVYRISEGSLSKPSGKKERLRFYLAMAEMRIYYCKKYHYEVPVELRKRYNHSLTMYKFYDPLYREEYPMIMPDILQRTISQKVTNRYWRNFFSLLYKFRMAWGTFIHLTSRSRRKY